MAIVPMNLLMNIVKYFSISSMGKWENVIIIISVGVLDPRLYELFFAKMSDCLKGALIWKRPPAPLLFMCNVHCIDIFSAPADGQFSNHVLSSKFQFWTIFKKKDDFAKLQLG